MNTETAKGKFVPAILPWLVAGAMLLVYLLTLNHWVTLGSLPLLGQVAGWNWPQNNLGAVHFLATFPLRWLPVNLLPAGLNLLAAVCAALTLALLARSVALLPHDRTQAQREREPSEFSLLSIRPAWLPPVLAVLACGLQLTFWENAMVGTGEMVDLLLFAYTVRCLLEFRIDGRQSWLTRAALVFGAAMANHWLMVILLPAFLVALFWIKGLALFQPRFLTRMAVAGLIGLSLLLLMPLVQSLADGALAGFGQTLRSNLGAGKTFLFKLPLKSLWVLGLTSLLPLVVMGIRWASSFGDSSPLGAALAAFMFHLVHGVFLIAGLWTMFDPPFSPRIFPRQFGLGFSWLTLYYLVALGIGYYSGYFLLVFGAKGKWSQPAGPLAALVNACVKQAVWVLLILVPAGLVCKNLPLIRASNEPALSTLAMRLAESLPQRDAVVLSDDAWLLSLAEAALNRQGTGRAQLLFNTAYLPYPAYHRFLLAKYPQLRQDDLATNQPAALIDSFRLIQFLEQQAQKRELYYLQPSFGYYFERFYLEPQGLVNQLKLLPTNAISAPPLAAGCVSANLDFWKKIDADVLTPLVQQVVRETEARRGWREWLSSVTRSPQEPDWQTQLAANCYSRALNWWGAELQKLGQWDAAGWCFRRAQDLNPDNVIAQINGDYNAALRDGNPTPPALSPAITDKLSQYRGWAQALAAHGPFDEPRFCYEQGLVFFRGGLHRQAAQQFDRAAQMSPGNWSAHLSLAHVYNLLQMPDQALEIARQARALHGGTVANQTNVVELARTEATAYFIKNEIPAAEQILQTALAAYPDDEVLLNSALQLYLVFQRYTNALTVVGRLLERSPDDANLLNNQGFVNIQLQQYEAAIPALDRVLALQATNFVARLNRAIAQLRNDHLDAARQDYEILQRALPSAYQVYYGLGEIAWRKKERSAAINYYQLYLTNAPPNTEERKQVSARLAELKSGSP
jgi:tetratricopeptide (TPR) repeat protein